MRKYEKWLPGLLIFAVLLASMVGGAAYAKYVAQLKVGGSLSITANLGSITVKESVASPNTDGSYTLGSATTNSGNTYEIIPGLDIPKNPYVTVYVASAIPVYVYIVVDQDFTNSPDGISYELEDCWKPVTGYTNVYVYSNSDGPIQVSSDATIDILKNDMVYVSQHLKANVKTSVYLKFTATMRQAVDGQTAEQIYANTNY